MPPVKNPVFYGISSNSVPEAFGHLS